MHSAFYGVQTSSRPRADSTTRAREHGQVARSSCDSAFRSVVQKLAQFNSTSARAASANLVLFYGMGWLSVGWSKLYLCLAGPFDAVMMRVS